MQIRIADIMSQEVYSCRPEDNLRQAAEMMRDHDCGCLPVIDARDELVGMITDRDICMCAATRGEPLQSLQVSDAITWQAFSCKPQDEVESVEEMLGGHQIRRLPVLDDNGRLKGMVSLADIARATAMSRGRGASAQRQAVAMTMAAISSPRLEPLRAH